MRSTALIVLFAALVVIAEFARLLAGGARGADEVPATKPDPVRIKLLIDGLGHSDFRTRNSATEDLRKLGEAALPFLKAAMSSDNLDIRRGAAALHVELSRIADERKLTELLNSVNTMGIDYLIDRIALDGERVRQDDWETIRRIALIAKERLTPKGLKILGKAGHPLHCDLSQLHLVSGKGVEKYAFGGERIVAESVSTKSMLADCLVVCAGPVQPHGMITGSIVFANGNIETAMVSNSVVLCNGNVRVTAGAVTGSVIVCNGDCHVEAGTVGCAVRSKGNIKLGGSCQQSHIVAGGSVELSFKLASETSTIKERESEWLPWLRFFSPERVGVHTESKESKVRVVRLTGDSSFRAAGLRQDDEVAVIGNQEVNSGTTFRNALRRALLSGRFEMTITRSGNRLTIPVSYP
jgi:hypothetical protein